MIICSKRIIAITVGAMLVACLSLAACSSGGSHEAKLSQTGGGQTETGQAEAAPSAGQNDPYTSDEACLACHGGAYEEVAERTASYGDSNPHDSVHGGYMSCNVCHAKGNEVTSNYCVTCHEWPRDLDCNPYD